MQDGCTSDSFHPSLFISHGNQKRTHTGQSFDTVDGWDSPGDNGPSDLEFSLAHSSAASHASSLSFRPFSEALVPYSWTRCT